MAYRFIAATIAALTLSSTALAQTSDIPNMPEGFEIPPEVTALMSPEDLAAMAKAMEGISEQMEGMGLEMTPNAGAGLDFKDMMTPPGPQGCLPKDDPNYVEPVQGDKCDEETYRLIILTQLNRLTLQLSGGPYEARNYQYTRDCTLAAGVATVMPMIAREDPGQIKLNNYADRQRQFWSRLFDFARDGRSVDTVVEDLERGDTDFARLVVGGERDSEAIDLPAIDRFYNRCKRTADAIEGPVESANE